MTPRVLAHSPECDTGFYPRCNGPPPGRLERYYAGQTGSPASGTGFSDGIQGAIKVYNQLLYDGGPVDADDHVSHWLSMVRFDNVGNATGWAQRGFREGLWFDGGFRTTPKLYHEWRNLNCQGYWFRELATPANLWDLPRIYWTGTQSTCNGTTVYWYWMGSQFNSPPEDLAQLPRVANPPFPAPLGALNFQAMSEAADFTHMEPFGGNQCFGTNWYCQAGGYDLWLWQRSTSSWSLWDWNRQTQVVENQDPGNGIFSNYLHNPIQQWQEFTTGAP